MSKYRIMTFDGGGIRGVLTGELLKELDIFYPKLIKNTHVFAGTSTGSFIALALAYGLSPNDIVNIYIEHGEYIFTPKNDPPIFEPLYSNKNLKRVLSSIFPKNLRLKDLDHKVIIPTFNLSSTETGSWGPVFLNNFPDSETKNAYVIEVALASSAAPIYFPSFMKHIDGAVVANNPSTAALSMALDECLGCQTLNDIVLLSIGTGFNSYSVHKNTKNWGLFEWFININPSMPLLTLLLDGSVEADSYYTSKLLKDNYFRINPKLNRNVGLDDFDKVDYLIDVAKKYNLNNLLKWIEKHWF